MKGYEAHSQSILQLPQLHPEFLVDITKEYIMVLKNKTMVEFY
ncbi:hypothetical protein [Terrisporobacter glycolicus]